MNTCDTSLRYKHEEVGKSPDRPYRTHPDRVTLESLVACGDTLYIPRGFVHEGIASDDASMHITVALQTSDWDYVHVISHAVERYLQGHFPARACPFVGSGKAGEGGKITIVDLRGLLTGKAKATAEPKEPKAVKAPKEPKAAKVPKEPKPETDARVTKKVRDLLHEWGLDESALVGCTPTAYKGTKFGVGDIAHLEPGLETGGKAKKTTGKGKASSAQSAPSESSGSDSDSDGTEEQDDDFDPFNALDAK